MSNGDDQEGIYFPMDEKRIRIGMEKEAGIHLRKPAIAKHLSAE